jgi:hypothetical protein
MNSHCGRLGLPPISFRETNVGEYAHNPDRAFKAQRRVVRSEEWREMSPAEQAEVMREWETMIAEAEPAHRTSEAFKADRAAEQVGEFSARHERQRGRRRSCWRPAGPRRKRCRRRPGSGPAEPSG